MMDTQRHLPLSEILRPTAINDLALPQKLILRLQMMINSGIRANMLFVGPPGTGKTSAAKLLLQARGGYGTLTIDGANETGIENVRNVVETFASCYAFTPGLKICFIDEGDYLSRNAQASLRGLIERYSENCRFICAVNDITKIDPAIRSRLLLLNFAVSKSDSSEILERTQKRVAQKLTDLGWSFDRQQLNQIVSDNFSDLRRMANKVDFEFGGQLTSFHLEQ